MVRQFGSIPPRGRFVRPLACLSAIAVVASAMLAAVGVVRPDELDAAVGPVAPEHLTLTRSDLEFILDQVLIAESHANRTRTTTGFSTRCLQAGDIPTGRLATTYPYQVTQPWGLRSVDGRCNNLVTGQSTYGAADSLFPRLAPAALAPVYQALTGVVVDGSGRVASNLVADQTDANPAAVAAAAANGDSRTLRATNPVTGAPLQLFELPNVTPDFGTSAPYDSWFTLFGQFFDHGLDLVPKGGSGTVLMTLDADDPLYVPNGTSNFMTLSRSTNQPGPDGVLGTADDVREAKNLTTPFVDQNQTYTSHPSHQVFLREYVLRNGRPFATGLLLDGRDGTVSNFGLPTWAEVKRQARDLLGITLSDYDISNVPRLATDQYGKFTPNSRTGFAQLVTTNGGLSSGTPTSPAATTNAARTGHAFLDDIAHSAVPFSRSGTRLLPDVDTTVGLTGSSATYYDNELLDAHYITGDGRGNENIGLTAVHHVFHAEHNTVADDIKALAATLPSTSTAALAQWQTAPGVWNGERLFQAARMVTEMEYQHIVFDEFARRVQPAIPAFAGYNTTVNAAISAEFAHAVYRFGHSMLNETVARINPDGSSNDIGLIPAFLNPRAFRNGGTAGTLSPADAAGAIATGMTRQRGNEIDEFVTEALRNNLVGLPLDLAALNMTRARETGVPALNGFRRAVFATTGASSLRPYGSWFELAAALRHPETVVNLMAAYGTHPTIVAATTAATKRAAAFAIWSGVNAPADAADFYNGAGTYATPAGGVPVTGLERVDLWIGGLAEAPVEGFLAGLLGSTFDHVFSTQLQRLQDGDRFYYLGRLSGTNLLAEIDGGSLAKLVQRNTGARHLPSPMFSLPSCTVEVGALTFVNGLATNAPAACSPIARTSDGTVRYDGQANVVFGGTNGNDRVRGGRADDTLWGDDADDDLDGGMGGDTLEGGSGEDVLTDIAGDDVMNGGLGNDAIAPGPGVDVVNGGAGSDFVFGGTGPKEIFGASGDDWLIGGDDGDAVIAGDGDDWLEGGAGSDVLTAQNGMPLNNTTVGNDVLVGGIGDDNYNGEGADDVLVDGPGVDVLVGGLGFDWVTYRDDPSPVDADLLRGALVVPPPGTTFDTYAEVEGVSGGPLNDVIRGDNTTAATLVGNELRNPGLIAGLSAQLRSAVSFAAGNILLGGAGSDTLEGRGGNDIVDGDGYLAVRISVRSGGAEIASASSPAELQAAVLGRQLSTLQFVVVREILTPADPWADTDTVVFSDVRANYTVTRLTDERNAWTVSHLNGAGIDGVDTVRNVERLRFTDQTVNLPVNRPGAGVSAFSPAEPYIGLAFTASPEVTDPQGINGGITHTWQYRDANGVWQDTGSTGRTITPTVALNGLALRLRATYTDGQGWAETVLSPVTAPVSAVQPLALAATPLPGATINTAYSTTLAASGGVKPYTWSVTTGNLPAGLTLSGGVISGTPTALGSQAFTVSLRDFAGTTRTQAYSITVANPVAITTAVLADATSGYAYSQALAASGGTTPYTWTVDSGSLPAGLVLNASTGVISGVSTQLGATALNVRLTDAGGRTTTRFYTLTVATLVAPAAFGKTSPANGATRAGNTSVALSWGDATRATSYEYCVDTVNNGVCDSAAGWVSTGVNHTVTVTGLARKTAYYWQVRARNAAGVTEADSTTWWRFTTG